MGKGASVGPCRCVRYASCCRQSRTVHRRSASRELDRRFFSASRSQRKSSQTLRCERSLTLRKDTLLTPGHGVLQAIKCGHPAFCRIPVMVQVSNTLLTKVTRRMNRSRPFRSSRIGPLLFETFPLPSPGIFPSPALGPSPSPASEPLPPLVFPPSFQHGTLASG